MPEPATDRFESLRPRLFGIAYRMLGIDRIAGLYRVMNPAKLAGLGRPTVLGPGQTLRDLLG